jgi:serine/threonine protein kinase
MIGKTIAHYRILEKLGEGGMGVVYKAEDTILQRTVALKFLPSELIGSSEWKERFIREAQAASALDHPSICTVHEIEEAENQTFIVMSYIDGWSVSEKIEPGPMDVEEAVDIAIQVAEGLQEAHDKGIIHCDIKSANIMVDDSGRVRITDFGLAKLKGKKRLTKRAVIMGTAAYLSPEQAHGDAILSHQTDIWSLGVVLYEMVTGRLPFDAATEAALIHKIIYEDPERIMSLRSDVPAALEQIIERMMQKDPRDRYEDMRAVADDLSTMGSTSPITWRRSSCSIAVLPFADMSPQKDQEYFCDGLAEEIINALSQIGDLRVIARTSAFSFKNKHLDIYEIGRKLKVQNVLEGSVVGAVRPGNGGHLRDPGRDHVGNCRQLEARAVGRHKSTAGRATACGPRGI